ncbi:MAG: hypothetical protein Q8O24_07145 [Gallionellaceae bacterium]|nr:hypothetical protein [Gallionellaceae bacterium]
MKLRLGIFAAVLAIFPLLALLLTEQAWVAQQPLDGAVLTPAAISAISLIILSYMFDALSFRRNGTSLLRTQLNYVLWLSYAGATLGALLSFLNTFVALWISPLDIFSELFVAALFGALLMPATIITRAALSLIPKLLRLLTRLLPVPAIPNEAGAWLLLVASLSGLLGGVAWPDQLTWLFWLAPLLLLIALQLFWEGSTIFSGLPQGDWSRVLLGALAGGLVLGGTLLLFKLSGGTILLTSSIPVFLLLLSAFGLLCLQLADLIAENGRGKKPTNTVNKKPFPIPVITKKD